MLGSSNKVSPTSGQSPPSRPGVVVKSCRETSTTGSGLTTSGLEQHTNKTQKPKFERAESSCVSRKSGADGEDRKAKFRNDDEKSVGSKHSRHSSTYKRQSSLNGSQDWASSHGSDGSDLDEDFECTPSGLKRLAHRIGH